MAEKGKAQFYTLKMLFGQLESLYLHPSSWRHRTFPISHGYVIPAISVSITWNPKSLWLTSPSSSQCNLCTRHTPPITAVVLILTLKSEAFLEVAPSKPVNRCRRFERSRCLHFQDQAVLIWLTYLPVDTVSQHVTLEWILSNTDVTVLHFQLKVRSLTL